MIFPTLYARRYLMNIADVHDWLSAGSVPKSRWKDIMHVTLAYSKTPVHYSKPLEDGERCMMLDDIDVGGLAMFRGNTPVLKLRCPRLLAEHAAFRAMGAKWDFTEVNLHLTFAKSGTSWDDLMLLLPYRGALVLGPIVLSEIPK